MIVKATSIVPIAGACGIAACLALASMAIYQWSPMSKKQQKLSARHLCPWFARTWGSSSFVLKRVRVPISVFPISDGSSSIIEDQEGLVECSILIQQGKIARISTILDDPSLSKYWTVDCYGSILIPCFSDAHTHLVKTQIVPRIRNMSGTMGEAYFTSEVADQPRWGIKGDVFRRMDFSARCALHHGTRAIRTHLDGCDSTDECVRREVYAAFDSIRDKYSPLLVVQGVANLYLPLWSTPMAAEHANTASTHENVVLGAYVGPPNDETTAAMDTLFGHAHRLSMDCDLHIDETNDPACCALLNLCAALSKARAAGYQGRVVLGHCNSLSLQDKATQDFICTQLAELQAYVVSNPFSNLGLQDRKGSEPPLSRYIPGDAPRTPQWRGLTLLQELRHAGVTVASASDNVRDHWYPYGDYDMLSVWSLAQAMGHLDTDPSEGSWADICTTAPAKAMGLEGSLQVGQPADVILFPSARRASELFSRPQVDRLVLRHGKVLTTTLPEFSELDDLVDTKA